MAVFNEILVGRFNRGLQKLFGLKGPAPSPQLSTEVMPVFPLPSGVEYRYLDGWEKFGRMVSLAAGGPATDNLFQLRNDAKSGVIAVVERLAVHTVTASSLIRLAHIEPSTGVDLANIVTVPARFDARGRSASTLVFSTNLAATGFSINAAIFDQGDLVGPSPIAGDRLEFIQTHNQEILLLPGDAIQVQNITQNVGTGCTFWWRERVLEESEKS